MLFKSVMFPIKATQSEGFNILALTQMLWRLPVALAQVQAGNTSENVFNEICQTKYSLYEAKEVTKKVYNNILNLIKV